MERQVADSSPVVPLPLPDQLLTVITFSVETLQKTAVGDRSIPGIEMGSNIKSPPKVRGDFKWITSSQQEVPCYWISSRILETLIILPGSFSTT